MSERLFSQEELDALCRSPKEQMAAVLATEDKEAAKQKYAELEDAFFGLPRHLPPLGRARAGVYLPRVWPRRAGQGCADQCHPGRGSEAGYERG